MWYLTAININFVYLYYGCFHAGCEAEFAGDLKRAIKMIRKNLGDGYLLIPLPEEDRIVSSYHYSTSNDH
jgi:hypothetical protein